MIVYLLTKLAAESAWCFFGLRRFRGADATSRIPSSARYGLVRLALGRVLLLPLEHLMPGKPELFVYACILVPLRWIAWSALGAIVATGEIRVRTLLGDRASNLWRLGGTAVSCAVDLPSLVAGIRADEFWP
jgi:hypothetical protein